MSKDKKKTAPEAAEETKAAQPEGKAEAEQTAASSTREALTALKWWTPMPITPQR